MDLEAVYQSRFNPKELAANALVWREIAHYLAKYFSPLGSVLDIACGQGEFINAVSSKEKWACDLRARPSSLEKEITFVQCSGVSISDLVPLDHFDCVFMSNYLEHLPSGQAVIDQLIAARKVIRPGGKVIILQPNVRLVGGKYWDYLDHTMMLTEKSLEEATRLASLTPTKIITRFLPYTSKSAYPKHPQLVRAYLKMPPIWFFLGKQTLLIATK